jgi:16S rRNA A1518/A1519 N6-dimethyltransferase RsmA/KsgA/DIM1 with predicted DNA glycosylase/AP lyase activity
MQKMGIDPKRRAETLNVEDWAKIAKEIERLGYFL